MNDGPGAGEPLVHIRNFRMDFGSQTVVRDLSFDVHAGETFGFLGSNGSGKTTTLRALLGIYQPTAGTLHIGGKVFEPRDGARLGYLPEERGLYKKESVLDVMVYFGRLKGLGRKGAEDWSRAFTAARSRWAAWLASGPSLGEDGALGTPLAEDDLAAADSPAALALRLDRR